MKVYTREGKLKTTHDATHTILRGMYRLPAGKHMIRALAKSPLTKWCGRYFDSRFSRWLIPRCIQAMHIDMSLYEDRNFQSYNDFFTRASAKHVRQMATATRSFCAPCDGKLTLVPLRDDATLFVKGRHYSLRQILRNERLAKEYAGGTALIFRLSVDDYHRYHYVDGGMQTGTYDIAGGYFSVDPAVLDQETVFVENSRSISRIVTDHFGAITYVEVGAMCVGKIVNHFSKGRVERGQEKGYFAFGGSTVILLIKRDAVKWERHFTTRRYESVVRMGDILGIGKKEA